MAFQESNGRRFAGCEAKNAKNGFGGMMAEAELTVRTEDEEIVFGIPGGLDIRMSLDEAQEFHDRLALEVRRAAYVKERREAREATTIDGAHRSDEEE